MSMREPRPKPDDVDSDDNAPKSFHKKVGNNSTFFVLALFF